MASKNSKEVPVPRTSKKSRVVLTRVSDTSSSTYYSRIVNELKRAAIVTKKLLKSTGKAAWISGTTFLILVVPLIIEMDREQQLNELELQQASLLGTPPVSYSSPPK